MDGLVGIDSATLLVHEADVSGLQSVALAEGLDELGRLGGGQLCVRGGGLFWGGIGR